MKTHQYILTIFLLTSSFISAQSVSENLLGTWEFNYVTSVSMMSPASKSYYDSMSATKQSIYISKYSNRKITFHNSGTYTQLFASGRSTTVIWSIYSLDEIVVTTPNGKTYTYTITSLDALALVLTPKKSLEALGSTVFTNWYLEKQ
ncbi:MAG: hypothetical protein ABJN28_11130 [Flavobacteriaceae bacterium]